MRWPECVVLIAGSTGSALPDVRTSQPFTSRRMPDAIFFTPPCSNPDSYTAPKNASAQRAERRSLTAGSLSSPQRHDDARSPPLRACCAHAENDQATAAPPTSAMKFYRRRRPKRLEASLTMKLPRRVSTRSDVDHAPSRPRGDVGPAQHTRRDYEEGAPSSSRWPMPATAERHAASSLI
jgi:hypothetical protein